MTRTRTAGAVVIGGGVVGASVAFHLARAGVEHVVLCERRTLGAGASGKSGGLVQLHYRTEPDARLGVLSLPYFEHWDDLVGEGSPRFEPSGFLALVKAKDVPTLRRNVDMLRAVGVNTSVIGREEVQEIAPYFDTSDVEAAAWEPGSGYAYPVGTLHGFAQAAQRRGAEILEQTQVTSVRHAGGRVHGVETTGGPIDTPIVVTAAGAWGLPMLRSLGLDLPLQSVRSQLAVFEWPPMEGEIKLVATIDRPNESYFRADEPGSAKVLVGVLGSSSALPDPDALEEQADFEWVARARAALQARIPGTAYVRTLGGWAGALTLTPDASPIIDRHPHIAGLFVFAGDAGRSFKTSPGIGLALSQLALEGTSSALDLRPFRMSRFAEGDERDLSHDYDDHRGIFEKTQHDTAQMGAATAR
jgi:sarcosine oxidase, subunit beta